MDDWPYNEVMMWFMAGKGIKPFVLIVLIFEKV